MKLINQQRGVTLIELMIAMTLGLMVTSAVLTMYMTTVRNFTQDERYARMQENGRYALRILAQDLSMADYWGQMTSPSIIQTALSVSDSCVDANGIDLFNFDTGILFNNRHAGTTQFTACSAVTTNLMGNADILAIKHMNGSPITYIDVRDLDGDGNTTELRPENIADRQYTKNGLFMRTNGNTGTVMQASHSAGPGPSADSSTLGLSDWEYQARIYFVRTHFDDNDTNDNIPALCKLELAPDSAASLSTDPVMGSPQCIAEGVEDLHIQWGIDTDVDGIANQYLVSPTLAQMEQAVTARIFLLMRSSDEDRAYSNTNTYTLGDVSVTITDDPATAGFDERMLYRRVFSTTVSLRNTANLYVFNF